MNIFALDEYPKTAARWHVDKHIVKMILESAQILCTVNYANGLSTPYNATHKNHPCVKWAGASLHNWVWLKQLAKYLNDEFRYRFNKDVNHKSWDVIESLEIPNLPKIGLTPFYQAMPEEYKIVSNPVGAYRMYYKYGKDHLHKWTKRKPPKWLEEI